MEELNIQDIQNKGPEVLQDKEFEALLAYDSAEDFSDTDR